MAGKEGNIKVSIRNVVKKYDTRNGEMIALNGANLDIMENEFICVIGPSGCGKSTLLNIIAGLLEPTSGEVIVDGHKVEGTGVDRGVVFQQYALFPWLTVKKNVQFGLKLQGKSQSEMDAIAEKYIKMVGLEKFIDSYPKELSGGMKQRVAIARAYAVNPSVLLMDEPFGALDPITREILQSEVKKIQTELNISVLFITHDMHEAMKMADRVIFMDRGRILQEAAPKEMVLHPANEEIRKFISLQEVTLSGDQLTAGDMMLPYHGIISADAPVVSATEGIREISRNIDLSKYKQIYVKDEHGVPVGELSMESIIQSLLKKV